MSDACIRCLFSLLLAMRVAALTVDDIQPYFTTIDEIAWIKILSCYQWTSPIYSYETPFTDIPSILDVVDSAIAIKFEPVNKTYATGATTTYAEFYVESKVCSNPVYCLNHGYELSYVVDVDTSLVTGLRDIERVRSALDFYVNSDNELRLENRAFSEGVSLGGYPRTLTEYIYQTYAGSGAGFGFVFDTICKAFYSHRSHVNPPMEIWLGFDPNGRVCMNNGNGEYVLSSPAEPTNVPTLPTINPSVARDSAEQQMSAEVRDAVSSSTTAATSLDANQDQSTTAEKIWSFLWQFRVPFIAGAVGFACLCGSACVCFCCKYRRADNRKQHSVEMPSIDRLRRHSRSECKSESRRDDGDRGRAGEISTQVTKGGDIDGNAEAQKTEQDLANEQQVRQWLASSVVGLTAAQAHEIANLFIANGYENMHIIREVEEDNLDEIGVYSAEHKSNILDAIKRLIESESKDNEFEHDRRKIFH